jgi:hypothetical protein
VLEIALQALQKSALVVVPEAQGREGPDIRMLRSNSRTGIVAKKAENLPVGKTVLKE